MIGGIKGITGGINPIELTEQVKGTTKSSQGPSFANMLGDAIKEVDGLQKQADQSIEAVTLGTDGVTTHQAMVVLEKADIAFQLMNTVRSKIIRAYEEVIRTQV